MTKADWLPIETAPRGGSDVLLIVNGKVRFGFWQSDRTTRPIGPRPFWQWSQSRGAAHQRANQPTHWMPLPEVPR